MAVPPSGSHPKTPQEPTAPPAKKVAKSAAEKYLQERFLEPFEDEIITPDEAAQKSIQPPSHDTSKIDQVFKKKSS